jgi:hypothetical protein
MSAQALIDRATEIRRRFRHPANAVVDHPIELRNGRPLVQIAYVETRVVDFSPQPVVSRGTVLNPARHLGTACLRGQPLPTKNASMDSILRAVAAEFNVSVLDLISHRRTRDVTRPRQVACYLARHMTILTLPGIGRRIGGRDHTTILAANRVIAREMVRMPDFAARVQAVKRRLEGRDD